MTARTDKLYHPPGKGVISRGTVSRAAGPGIFRVIRVTRQVSQEALIRKMRQGFPVAALDSLVVDLGVSQQDLLKVIRLASPTLARRRREGAKRLTSEESGRLYRVVSVFRHAIDLFDGNAVMAARWLREPAKALGGEAPLSYLDTEVGAEVVHDLIRRIEYGVVA